MTVKEIFDLRKQGRIEEAYETIRPMYRVHKGHYTSLCMYLCARDVFNIRLAEGCIDEASKIYQALQRLVPFIGDKDGTVSKFMSEANARLNALRSAMPCKGNITESGSARMTAPTGQNTLAQGLVPFIDDPDGRVAKFMAEANAKLAYAKNALQGQNTLAQGLAPGDVEMPPSEPCRGDITPPRVLTLGIPDPKLQRLLEVVKGEMSVREMMAALNFHSRDKFLKNYLSPALKAGLVEMTEPDSPKSPKQKYRRAKGDM